MFKDKNGKEIKVGDHIIPNDGKELVITSIKAIEDLEGDVMIGRQVENMDCFSLLEKSNLEKQWTLKGE